MYDITSSIVTFRNNLATLEKTIKSFLNTELKVKLYIVDNSHSNEIINICKDRRVEYIFNNKNLGFGAAHNIVIRKIEDESKYHLILNPDIYFSQGTLEKVLDFMEINRDIGFVLPKVLYPNGSLQYLCRLLPKPLDLFLRRFNFPFLRFITEKQDLVYELKFADYNKPMDVPYLSGCFMFIRNDIFKYVGIFDERFFMYFEDLDLSRRIHKKYRTVYYPDAVIFHEYEKGSSRSIRLLKYHIFSTIKYFNKWGWFFDKERMRVNNKTLEYLKR
jgi:hypothetical protein